MSDAAVLKDGQFCFKVETASGPMDRSIDVIMLRLACNEAEAMHKLAAGEDGLLKPTTAFLVSLAQGLKAAGLKECTPTMAYQLWLVADRLVEDLKKNTSETPRSVSGTELTPPNSPPSSGSDSISTSIE